MSLRLIAISNNYARIEKVQGFGNEFAKLLSKYNTNNF